MSYGSEHPTPHPSNSHLLTEGHTVPSKNKLKRLRKSLITYKLERSVCVCVCACVCVCVCVCVIAVRILNFHHSHDRPPSQASPSCSNPKLHSILLDPSLHPSLHP